MSETTNTFEKGDEPDWDDQCRADNRRFRRQMCELYGLPETASWHDIIGHLTGSAVLINAELYAACELALKTIDGLAEQQAMPDDGYLPDVVIIRAALAKAKGGP